MLSKKKKNLIGSGHLHPVTSPHKSPLMGHTCLAPSFLTIDHAFQQEQLHESNLGTQVQDYHTHH